MPTAPSLLTAAALLLATALCLYLGRRLGQRRLSDESATPPAGRTAIQSELSGLLTLLLAFTVVGAATRFDSRRLQIIDETNALSTAWLRIDLVPEEAQPALRARFRTYLASRIATYRKLPDVAAARAEL